MAPTGSVLVHVSELGQGSVPGKLIELVGTPLSGSTDGNGEVLFDVRPGRYVVRAHINAPGPADHVDQGVEVKSAHTVRVEFANCAPCGSPTS